MKKEIEIEELKKIQLDILTQVAEFCDKNGLRYFLAYGTLIGAVRHKGYIPWDDDIDIVVSRADYQKLLTCFTSQDLEIVSPELNRDCPHPFAKIYNTKTQLIELSDIKFDIGINIDVFPLDFFPDDQIESERLVKRIRYLRKMLEAKVVVVVRKRSLIKNTILFIAKCACIFLNYRTLIQKIVMCSQTYNETNLVGCLVWGYGIKERVSKEIFNDSVEVEFEREKFKAPIGYDQWLKHIYGDYMQLPPEEKRESHHAFKAYWKE